MSRHQRRPEQLAHATAVRLINHPGDDTAREVARDPGEATGRKIDSPRRTRILLTPVTGPDLLDHVRVYLVREPDGASMAYTPDEFRVRCASLGRVV